MSVCVICGCLSRQKQNEVIALVYRLHVQTGNYLSYVIYRFSNDQKTHAGLNKWQTLPRQLICAQKGPLVQNRLRACHPYPQLTDRATSHSKNTYPLKSTWCHVMRKTCKSSPKNTSKTFQILHSVLAGPLLKDRWPVFPLLPPWNNKATSKAVCWVSRLSADPWTAFEVF